VIRSGLLSEHFQVFLAELMALSGDRTAMRLCMERLISIAKAPGTRFRLPKMKTASDLKHVLPNILKQTSKGKITAYEAEAVARVVETQQRTLEFTDFVERIQVLEERQHQGHNLMPAIDDNLKPVIEEHQ